MILGSFRVALVSFWAVSEGSWGGQGGSRDTSWGVLAGWLHFRRFFQRFSGRIREELGRAVIPVRPPPPRVLACERIANMKIFDVADSRVGALNCSRLYFGGQGRIRE